VVPTPKALGVEISCVRNVDLCVLLCTVTALVATACESMCAHLATLSCSRFLNSPNFRGWLAQKQKAANGELMRQYLCRVVRNPPSPLLSFADRQDRPWVTVYMTEVALQAESDLMKWASKRTEIEVLDLYLQIMDVCVSRHALPFRPFLSGSILLCAHVRACVRVCACVCVCVCVCVCGCVCGGSVVITQHESPVHVFLSAARLTLFPCRPTAPLVL
jgi:hypothetical protein